MSDGYFVLFSRLFFGYLNVWTAGVGSCPGKCLHSLPIVVQDWLLSARLIVEALYRPPPRAFVRVVFLFDVDPNMHLLPSFSQTTIMRLFKGWLSVSCLLIITRAWINVVTPGLKSSLLCNAVNNKRQRNNLVGALTTVQTTVRPFTEPLPWRNITRTFELIYAGPILLLLQEIELCQCQHVCLTRLEPE